jgi:hypothetical protein
MNWRLGSLTMLAALLASGSLFAEQPPPDSAVPASKASAWKKREIASFGMIALVKEDPPTSHAAQWWTRTDLGPTEESTKMWAQSVGDGYGGLALSGIGLGGGGRVDGASGEGVHTVGGGQGVAELDALDHGRGHLAEGGKASAKVPESGDQPTPLAIQRIVRQGFGALRLCYDWGLRSSPHLHGRVVVKFSIEHDGSVSTAADRDSDLPDADVVSCVVRGFLNLSFPRSANGRVTVVYPLLFTPEGADEP